MAFPRINALSFWLLPVGGLTILAGFLAKGGARRGRVDELRRRCPNSSAPVRTSG